MTFDHGMVNLPLDKRGEGSLDGQIDRHLKRIKAEDAVRREQALIDYRERSKAIPFTDEQLTSATIARVAHGWYRIIRVNKATVTLDDPHYAQFRVPLAKILEVK